MITNIAFANVCPPPPTSTLKSNVSGKFRNIVIVISTAGTLLMVVLISILEMYTIGGLLAAVFLIGISILYLLGARSLAGVMATRGKKSPRLLQIVATARKVAALVLTGVVCDVGYVTLITMRQPSIGINFLTMFLLWIFQGGLMSAGAVIVFFVRDM